MSRRNKIAYTLIGGLIMPDLGARRVEGAHAPAEEMPDVPRVDRPPGVQEAHRGVQAMMPDVRARRHLRAIERKAKPRLKDITGNSQGPRYWRCWFADITGYGQSPKEAFQAWKRRMAA